MLLSDIVKKYKCDIIGNAELQINDITCDSRNVKQGSMFFCIKGYKIDGHDYAKTAVDNGAVAIVVTKKLDLDITQIVVDDDRKAMAIFSREFFENPQNKMQIVGITGTNGKTTTSYLCSNIAKSIGKKVGIIGTICNVIDDEEFKTNNTTPESVELYRLLAKMVQKNIDIVFMEVSSHSLYLDRVYGIEFSIGAFTNLSQDHLDFHETMEKYIEAKSILFTKSKISIINADDQWCDYLTKKSMGKYFTYSIDSISDYMANNINATPFGNSFEVEMESKCIEIDICIPGRFSVYNALCAFAICCQLGIDDNIIIEGLKNFNGVNGRCQVLKKQPFTIILDYAHTPDGLKNILSTFKGMGRLVSVFGCGGNRDTTKRPIMGKIGGDYSDFVILTSDNPRFENPHDIVLQVEDGVKQSNCPYIVIEDRRQAIKYAIENAKDNDIIILAGKGHETYQDVCGVKHDFDEKIIVNEILSELKK